MGQCGRHRPQETQRLVSASKKLENEVGVGLIGSMVISNKRKEHEIELG